MLHQIDFESQIQKINWEKVQRSRGESGRPQPNGGSGAEGSCDQFGRSEEDADQPEEGPRCEVEEGLRLVSGMVFEKEVHALPLGGRQDGPQGKIRRLQEQVHAFPSLGQRSRALEDEPGRFG